MLVLTRKLHQSILIGDAIRITVLGVREGQVRLGIDAPRDVSVLREEVVHAAASSNREACAGRATSEEALGGVAALFRLSLTTQRPE